jgi:hypothetical protein
VPEGAVLDTDVLLKVAAWDLGGVLCGVVAPLGQPGVLGLTHLIARKQLHRLRNLPDAEAADTALSALLAQLARLEPSEDEVALAAEFAEAALVQDLPLDRGEAQIAAVVVTRGLPLMISGDKRALGALRPVLREAGRQGSCDGRVACLEQVLAAMVERVGASELRRKVCAWPGGDVAASICFACGRDGFSEEAAVEGLTSYIGHVRNTSGGTLLCESIAQALASARTADSRAGGPPSAREGGTASPSQAT